jgi:5-dehydro-2-deoxygluconokinase
VTAFAWRRTVAQELQTIYRWKKRSKGEKVLDLVAIGRAGVDLYGEQVGGRLEDMSSFAKYIGGSPTNTAAGAARLGLRSALITRVGDDHMGRFIREELRREGVDVRGVLTDPERLTALVILGIRDRESFPLIFYRENCADMALTAADVSDDLVKDTRAVLVNGTHLSRPGVFRASQRAAKVAKGAGARVVFDVDYRPVLWGLAALDQGENRFVPDPAVTERLQEILPLCDLVVGTEEEMRILGGAPTPIESIRRIRERTDALIVCKLGAQGCAAFPGDIPASIDAGVVHRGFPVEVFNVLGAGDAFMAGFLRGWLRDEPLQRCCTLANACGAIVVSRHGCTPAMPTWHELERFLAASEHPLRLREDVELEHVHWATTRRGDYREIAILAMDHRSQFEDLARECGADFARIAQFKALGLRAVDRVAAGNPGFGLLVDGRHGFETLAAAAGMPYWIGRPIEQPRSRPLEFEGSADVATELSQWPAGQVVKCLVHYHPDDEPALRERQERQLARLFDACRRTRHELLLEVILPTGSAYDEHTASRAMRRIYSLGVRPDWWKLEPVADAGAWKNIERAIEECDPYCRGVVLLGLSAPESELVASFQVAARFPRVKGVAVGRTIFNEAAQRWFSGAISDEGAVTMLAEKFAFLVAAWRSARASVEAAA